MLTGDNCERSNEYKNVENETINCILFEIIVSIVILVYGFVFQMLLKKIPNVWVEICAGVFYYMIFFLILNMFIIVKRFKLLNENK